LVSKEEIEKVAKLMKIELDDHSVHIERVQKMIEYFDILDKAGVESEELLVQELPLTSLREDKHIPYNDKLIQRLKNYKGTHIKAPKMV
jgi:aspartyl-tRNA(Asn)/glutamyl-tRNA(Gln) amidotransferase subunit C